MDEKNETGLLEFLARSTNAVYLSDLRNKRYYPSLIRELQKMDTSQYTATEWNEAVFYILHTVPPSNLSALEYLITQLKARIIQ